MGRVGSHIHNNRLAYMLVASERHCGVIRRAQALGPGFEAQLHLGLAERLGQAA